MTVAEFISCYDRCAINFVPMKEAIKLAEKYNDPWNEHGENWKHSREPYVFIRFQDQRIVGQIPDPYLASDPCFQLDEVADWDDLINDPAPEVTMQGLDSLL